MNESFFEWVSKKIKELENNIGIVYQLLTNAIDREKKNARNYTDSTRRALESLINSINTNTNNNITYLYNKTNSLQNQIDSKVLNWVIGVSDYATQLYHKANNNAISYSQGVVKYAEGLANGLRSALPGIVMAVVGPNLFNLGSRIGNIENIINKASCIINVLTNDPLNFVISLVEFFFIDWVQWQIANAFGTQRATLPNKPTFTKKIC